MRLTILCLTPLSIDWKLLDEIAAANQGSVKTIDMTSFRTELAAAIQQGPVLLIAKGAREASSALALNVDEVIRAHEFTRENLTQAVARARRRADLRLGYDLGCTTAEYNALKGFELLTASIVREVSQPLRLALIKSEIASREMARSTLPAGQDAPNDPDRTPSGPYAAAARISKMLEQSQFLLQRAESFVSVFEACDGGERDSRDVRELLEQVARLVRDQVHGADVRVQADSVSIAETSRPFLMCLVAIILAHAIDLLRQTGNSVLGVELRAFEQEDVVVVEVEYRGAPASPSAVLKSIRDCLASVRGDLLVDSDAQRTVVRLFLPRLLGMAPATAKVIERNDWQNRD
jgi:hypothetical protein